MTLNDDKDACEMVETVKDGAELEAVDTIDEQAFRRHSRSLVRKLDMTLMPTVSLTIIFIGV